MKWFLYIAKCTDESLYCGITKDVPKRISEHSMGKGAKYTRGKGPLELLYSEEFENHKEAAQREYQIKKWPRRLKDNLIRSQKPDFKLKDDSK